MKARELTFSWTRVTQVALNVFTEGNGFGHYPHYLFDVKNLVHLILRHHFLIYFVRSTTRDMRPRCAVTCCLLKSKVTLMYSKD